MGLVQKAKEPDGNIIVATHFSIVARIEYTGFLAFLPVPVAHADLFVLVDNKQAGLLAHFYGVVAPDAVCEEGFHYLLVAWNTAQDGIQQVRVVHQNARRLFGSLSVHFINLVNQACFLQVVHVVGHGGARGAYFLGQIAHVGRPFAAQGEQVEQLLEAWQIFHVDLFNKEDVNFQHRINRLQQVLCEVVAFHVERIITVVQVILKIVPRANLDENILLRQFGAIQYVVERDAGQVSLRLEVDVFAERESVEHVAVADARQFVLRGVRPLNGRRSINDVKLRKAVIALTKLILPAVLLENLVDDKYFSATLYKFFGKVHDTASLEVKAVHVDVQATSQIDVEILLGVLQQERCLAYAARSLDANHPVRPVDFVHQRACHGSVGMLNEVSMSLKEILHVSMF